MCHFCAQIEWLESEIDAVLDRAKRLRSGGNARVVNATEYARLRGLVTRFKYTPGRCTHPEDYWPPRLVFNPDPPVIGGSAKILYDAMPTDKWVSPDGKKTSRGMGLPYAPWAYERLFHAGMVERKESPSGERAYYRKLAKPRGPVQWDG